MLEKFALWEDNHKSCN